MRILGPLFLFCYILSREFHGAGGDSLFLSLGYVLKTSYDHKKCNNLPFQDYFVFSLFQEYIAHLGKSDSKMDFCFTFILPVYINEAK